MAYFDLKVKENEKIKNTHAKIVGFCFIILASLIFLTLLTSFLPWGKSFLLGVFGLFIYPLSIIVFCIGIALLNKKKYVMPAKYLIYLSCATYCLLCLINIIIIGNPECTFFEYLGKIYDFQYTAGGLLAGFLIAPFIKTIGLVATIIIFLIVLVIFVALIIDFLNTIKVYGFKHATEKKNNFKTVEVEKKENIKKSEKNISKVVNEEKEDFNIFLDKKFEHKENKDAFIKLGLIQGTLESAKSPEKKKSLREQLLTPNETIDLNYYRYKDKNKSVQINPTPQNKQDTIQNKNEKLYDFFSRKTFESPISESKQEIINESSAQQSETFENVQIQDNAYNELVEEENDINVEEKTNVNEQVISSERKFVDLSEDEERPIEVTREDNYIAPPITLLDNHKVDLTTLNQDVVGKRIQLESTLEEFGINAKVIGVVIGPSVTRYELEMPQGVSVKRIISLEDDISLALAAKSGIRIEAPIPGKSAVGIEVPNESISTVSLREVIETDIFQNNKSPVTFALGKNISGMPELCNLAKMPHILVAGATNSGKSICLNATIISMIYKASPEDLRLILIDPKHVEFSAYNDLPHLLIPNVITDVNKAVNALQWCVNEMERRFELLSKARCRNSDDYNHMPEVLSGNAPKMPYIVVIIDELADLMSSGKKEIEEHLRRLTQKSRAAGILLVLATQRPSVDVITGVIKTNCPARISFALASNTDSRTILDCSGAETLLGRGDMLYKPSDAPVPRRVQGCFVSSQEVERIVDFIKQNNVCCFDEKAKETIDKEIVKTGGAFDGSFGDQNWDPLLPQALKMFIENGQASTSAIQRRFLTGFPRSSRIVDQLCQMGYLSEQDGTKPRNVLITMEQFYEKFGKDFE